MTGREFGRVGVQPDTVVALCMTRSFAMVVGALQILKAAGASLPVDPGYPQAHISHILADAKVPVAEGPFLDIK